MELVDDTNSNRFVSAQTQLYRCDDRNPSARVQRHRGPNKSIPTLQSAQETMQKIQSGKLDSQYLTILWFFISIKTRGESTINHPVKRSTASPPKMGNGIDRNVKMEFVRTVLFMREEIAIESHNGKV